MRRKRIYTSSTELLPRYSPPGGGWSRLPTVASGEVKTPLEGGLARLFSFGASESSCYARRVWCRGLAGCPASRAALRRPSALRSVHQEEGCFRLAGRAGAHAQRGGLGQLRESWFRPV